MIPVTWAPTFLMMAGVLLRPEMTALMKLAISKPVEIAVSIKASSIFRVGARYVDMGVEGRQSEMRWRQIRLTTTKNIVPSYRMRFNGQHEIKFELESSRLSEQAAFKYRLKKSGSHVNRMYRDTLINYCERYAAAKT